MKHFLLGHQKKRLATILLYSTVACAQAQAPQEYLDLPRQALAEAIQTVGSRMGVAIAFDPETVRSHTSPAIQGEYTPGEALEALLKGSGLELRELPDGAYVISSSQGSSSRRQSGEDSEPDASGQGASAAAKRAQAPMIEEVIVTAQKREQTLQESPLSISAFGAAQLEAAGAFNIADIGEITPNVTLLGAAASNSTMAVTIRGVQSQEPSLAVDSKVGLYIDGVYYARLTGALFDVADLERIEVLRGPQGTLWGRNTIGGAINAITKRPAGELGFEQKLSAGNYGYYRSITSLDTPEFLGVSAKLSYMKTERDGLVKNTFKGAVRELGDSDAEALRVAVRWQPAGLDALIVDYAYDRYESDAAPRSFQLTEVDPGMAASPTAFVSGQGIIVNPYHTAAQTVSNRQRSKVYSDFVEKESTRLSGHALTVSWAFESAELKAITAYRDYKRKLDGSDFDGGVHAVPLFHSSNDESQHQFSQELQLVGDGMESRLQYVAGLYYFEEKAKSLNPQTTSLIVGLTNGIPTIMSFPSSLLYTTNNESWAAYTQLSYTPDLWSDRLTLTLGARYTEDKKAVDLRSENMQAGDKWSNFNPSFTAAYALSDNINT